MASRELKSGAAPRAGGATEADSAVGFLCQLGRDPEPVRAFRTFTPDLQALVEWLIVCVIDTVAMEYALQSA